MGRGEVPGLSFILWPFPSLPGQTHASLASASTGQTGFTWTMIPHAQLTPTVRNGFFPPEVAGRKEAFTGNLLTLFHEDQQP